MRIWTTDEIKYNAVNRDTEWVTVDDILKEIKTIDKWHSTHRTKSLIKTLEDV